MAGPDPPRPASGLGTSAPIGASPKRKGALALNLSHGIGQSIAEHAVHISVKTSPLLLASALGFFLVAAIPNAAAQDWPQWRGPERNGIAAGGPALAVSWPDDKPPLRWEAKILPREGGEGSPVVAGSKVFVFANEPRDLATKTRKLDARFYQKIQWFDPDKMPADELKRIEETRQNLPVGLKGRELKTWITEWTEKNFEAPARQRSAARRLSKGDQGVSADGMRMLKGVRDRTFGNESIFLNWLDDNEVTDEDRELILKALPDTERKAKDVIFCVDAASGEKVWDTVLEGVPESRIGSSTPAVVDGRLYVFGTTHAHCLNVADGALVWSTKLPQDATASSPLITDRLVVGLAGHLVAFDRASGKIAWERPELKGRRSSPVRWQNKILVKAEGSRKLACVNPADGSVAWTADGDGDSTPSVANDIAVVHGKKGVVAYNLYEDRAEQLWTHDYEDTRGASSPVVVGGSVVVFPTTGATAFDLLSGKVLWNEGFKSGIISPIAADGKLLYLSNGAQFLTILNPADGEELAKVRMKGTRCASAALAGSAEV